MMHRQDVAGKVGMVNRLGKIAYLFLVLAGGGFFSYLCWASFFPKP
jgi:hypothetical protein